MDQPLTRCRACGRQFTRYKVQLRNEKQYCRRATKYGGYCDDKRCVSLRGLAYRQAKAQPGDYKKIKSTSTENIIKMQEQSVINRPMHYKGMF